MEINGVQFDLSQCLHNIALEYAKRDLDAMIAQGRVSLEETTGCLDNLFDSYIQAFAYLAQKPDDYIKSLAENS